MAKTIVPASASGVDVRNRFQASVSGDLAFIFQRCARKTDATLCKRCRSNMRKFRHTAGDAVLVGISGIDKSLNGNHRLTRTDPIGMYAVGDCVLQQQHSNKGNCLSRGIKAFQLHSGAGIRIHHPAAFGHPLYRKGQRFWRLRHKILNNRMDRIRGGCVD